MTVKVQVRRSDIRFDRIAGQRVLVPVATSAEPGERIEIEWYPEEWIAVKRISVWRVNGKDAITPITPMLSIGALFTLNHYEIASHRTEVGLVVPEWAGDAVTAGPGCRFAIELLAHADVPPDTAILVTVAVELPPPCFQPRAAA
jgi:hypothetical protein